MNSPIQLKHIEFTEISIRENKEGHIDNPYHFAPHVKVGTAEGNKHECRIQVKLEIGSEGKKPFAYQIQIQVTGYFSIHPEFPEGQIEPTIAINGTSLLYGSIREMLLTTTPRFSKGTLMLPTLDFRNILKDGKRISEER